MNERFDTRSLAIGIMVGVAIGAAIGYLTAPQPGLETRKMINEKMDEIKNTAEEIYQKSRDTACSVWGAKLGKNGG